MHSTLKALLISAVVFGSLASTAVAQERKTIWSGIFNEEQAARGQMAFVENCGRCHVENLSGSNGPALKGEDFVENHREANLGILLSTVRSMPPSIRRDPSTRLPDNMYLDILTYILQGNGAQAGPAELTAEAVPSIQFEKQTGPEPVPNLSLVSLVGCLSETSPTLWTLTSASEPVRVMDPDVLSPADLATGKAIALGRNSYRLNQVDYIPKPIADYKDQHIQVKGTLVRQQDGNTRVNLTALETIAPACQ